MEITTFKWVPPFAQGYVKDLCIRWALEEIGASYTLRLVGAKEMDTDAYRRLQPFEEIPVFEDGGITLFESGSIVLYISEKSETLLPVEPAARARARTWVIAALNSIEPFIQNFIDADDSRRPETLVELKERLSQLESWMKDRAYLEKEFTVGDIMMTTVIRHLVNSGVLREFPNLDQYRERCEGRPAFKKALAEQLKTFADHVPVK